MHTTHDDVPHPVPPTAYLRYKENWLFILIDADRDAFGIAHFNYEPGFDRARISCNLMVQGRLYKYSNQMAFPPDFAYSTEIGDGKLGLRFVEAYTRMELWLESDDVSLSVTFTRNAPPFDFETYEAANPQKPKAQEILNFSTNQEFHHQQQAMTISGSLSLKAAPTQIIPLQGLGYRDHSRGMRADNMLLRHVWAFLYFPSTVLGVMSVTGSFRPGVTSTSGYVYDGRGMRSLGEIDIDARGADAGQVPESVVYTVKDVYGNPFRAVADIANRLAHVPLVAEASGPSGMGYTVIENFCRVTLQETGESGYALIEIGFSTTPMEHK
jgi:hypothetical protein